MIMDCSKYVGPCSCGRDHELETKMVVVEYDALSRFEEYMAAVGLGDLLGALRHGDRGPRQKHEVVEHGCLALFDIDLTTSFAVKDHLIPILLDDGDGLLRGGGDLKYAQLDAGEALENDLVALIEFDHCSNLLSNLRPQPRLHAYHTIASLKSKMPNIWKNLVFSSTFLLYFKHCLFYRTFS